MVLNDFDFSLFRISYSTRNISSDTHSIKSLDWKLDVYILFIHLKFHGTWKRKIKKKLATSYI